MVGSYPQSPQDDEDDNDNDNDHHHLFMAPAARPSSSAIPRPLDGPQQCTDGPQQCTDGPRCAPKLVLGTNTRRTLQQMMWRYCLSLPPKRPVFPGTMRIGRTGAFGTVRGRSPPPGPSLEELAARRGVRPQTMYLLEAMRTVLGYRLLWSRQPCPGTRPSYDHQARFILRRYKRLKRAPPDANKFTEMDVCADFDLMEDFSSDNTLTADEANGEEWVGVAERWLRDRERSGACFCYNP